ncbi:Ras-GEF domain-containing protein, partial [Aspergillus ibericus CBS 121593]
MSQSHSQHTRKRSTMPINTTPTTPPSLFLDHENEVMYHTTTTTNATNTSTSNIKHATLPTLTTHLTHPSLSSSSLDPLFTETFLLTYPTFTTAHELSDLLIQHLHLTPPPTLSGGELHRWTEQIQTPIRVRTINVLILWIEKYWMEEGECSLDLLRYIHTELRGLVEYVPTATTLLTIIEERIKGTGPGRLSTPPTTATISTSTSKNRKKIKLLDLDEMEFARQLTLLESGLYAGIRPGECLDKAWQRKSAARRGSTATGSSANTSTNTSTDRDESGIKAIINHSNHLSRWIVEMILGQKEMRKRVAVVKFFIGVADKCKILQNYATTTTIISALGTTPIYRLQRTWSHLPPRYRTLLADMQSLMSSERNFAKYRDTLRGASLPCIPFLGVYLTDLTFLTDGMPDFAPMGPTPNHNHNHTPDSVPDPLPPPAPAEQTTSTQTKLINFHKRSKLANVIREIRRFQHTHYTFVPVGEVQELIVRGVQSVKRSIVKEGGEDGDGDGERMYEWSLKVE